MTEKTGTFLVTHADADSVVVRDVETTQVHTLATALDVDVHEVLEATIAPEPPLEVVWEVLEVHDQHAIELVDSDLEPTTRSKELAADAPTGDVRRDERAGRGEVHVVRLLDSDLDAAARDILDDEETVARAARLDAVRVEVRRAPDCDVLSVRYLPE